MLEPPQSDPKNLRVSVDINRRDILEFALWYFFSPRVIRLAFPIGAVFLLGGQLVLGFRPVHWAHAIYWIIFVSLQWSLILLAVATLMAVGTMLQCLSAPGLLGSHTFEVRPDGFFESTSVNQTLTRWGAIRRVARTRRQIRVAVTWWMFYLIPRRAFEDAGAYEAFFEAVDEGIRNAEPAAQQRVAD